MRAPRRVHRARLAPRFTAFMIELMRTAAGMLDSAVLFLPLAGGMLLVERRSKRERLEAHRSVEIASLLDSIPEAALIVDAAGTILDLNPAAAELASGSREQLRGVTVEALERMLLRSEAKPTQFTPAVLRRVFRGAVVRQETRVICDARGAQVELLISASPIRNQAGEVLGVLVIARDVTELTQLQRRLGDLERHHAVGEMAAALAHDFSNLLDTIGQAAAVLEMQGEAVPPAQRLELLRMITNAVRRGAEIVARVREYLRTGTGIMAPVDISQVLEESIELTRPLWQRMHVTVTRKLNPAGQVKANAAELRRVFTNLIVNAIDAMPDGGELTVSCELNQTAVVVSVSDTGHGIPEHQQPEIFRPYFTTKARGTGLGLSGAQKYILSQGGHITFTTQAGKGTRFTVTLPLLPPAASNPAA